MQQNLYMYIPKFLIANQYLPSGMLLDRVLLLIHVSKQYVSQDKCSMSFLIYNLQQGHNHFNVFIAVGKLNITILEPHRNRYVSEKLSISSLYIPIYFDIGRQRFLLLELNSTIPEQSAEMPQANCNDLNSGWE